MTDDVARVFPRRVVVRGFVHGDLPAVVVGGPVVSCCECRVVEYRGVDGPTTQVETNANCPCESCHEPWDALTAARSWMHQARTTTNHHPQGASR